MPMQSLRTYLATLRPDQQDAYAKRSGTSIGYLRKVLSTGQAIGAELAIELDRESDGAVPVEETSPDVDWAYIRATAARKRGRESRSTGSSRPS